jgi:alpha-L-fucosidase
MARWRLAMALLLVGLGTLGELAAEPVTGPAGTSARDAGRDTIRAIARSAAGATSRPADSDPGAAPAEVVRWLAANRESVRDVTPGPLKDLPWGVCTSRPAAEGAPTRLYLHVFDWHASGNVIAYGLAGGVKRAYLLADPARAELPVSGTGRDTVVAGPKKAPDPADTVVVLELDGDPKIVPLAVTPAPDGSVLLHAKAAIVHGQTVRYEPDPKKNTVGYWTSASDFVEWQFEVPAAGAYSVEILQGCGTGSGGSTVDFTAAGQTLPVTVQDTGGFQNFVPREIGRFEFPKPGRYTLTVKPKKKPGLAVMDLRQVKLTPGGGK